MRTKTSLRSFAFVLGIALGAAACGPPPEVGDHLRRGNAALEAGRYSEALAAFAAARELAPNDGSVQRASMRARTYQIAQDPSRITPETIDQARYEAQVLIETDGAHKAVYLTALASVARRQGNLEEARAKLEEAVKAEPGNALAHAALGTLLLGNKDTAAEAKTELEAALKAKPDEVGALVGMAQIKASEGDRAGAASMLVAALKVREDFATRMTLGRIYLADKKAAEAAEQLAHAALLDPKSADAFTEWGKALLAAGRAEDAEGALRTALELRPDPATANALGMALVKQKKAEEASEIFAKTISRDSQNAEAQYGAGMAAEILGRTDEAAIHYWALAALKPGASDKQALADMQDDAKKRMAAIQAAAEPPPSTSASPSASAAASAAPSAPQAPSPTMPTKGGKDPLGKRD
ncbi:MAG: tetratricopeptide repeat protein [Polyangiaceae bacterium]